MKKGFCLVLHFALKWPKQCILLLPSLQPPGGKAEPATTVAPLFGKPGNASTGIAYTGLQKTGGIQIKISPAPERTICQTKMPPKTCFKVIGKESNKNQI